MTGNREPGSRITRAVGELMTPLPHTIGVGVSLARAEERMCRLGIRHLPVIEDGALVGILSDRDIACTRSRKSGDFERIPIEDAMTPEPYAVGPDVALAEVVRTMAEKKYGCVVVVELGKVVGLVSTVDLMHAFADLLSARVGYRESTLLPSEVRRRILGEHEILRAMLDEVDRLGARVLDGSHEAEPILRQRTRELYRTLLRHIDLEDAILAPALLETDAYGPLRAEELTKEHEKQRSLLGKALWAIDESSTSALTLAESVMQLVPSLLEDMAHEEKDLLDESLLKDDPIDVHFTG